MKQKKRYLEQGHSLVEISVAMGLIGLVALIVIGLSDTITHQTKKTGTILSKSHFISSLENYAMSAAACNEFRDLGPVITHPTSFDNNPTREIVFNNWRVAGIEGDPTLPLVGGREFKDFTLLQLRVITPIPQNLPTIRVGTIVGVKSILQLRARLQFKGDNPEPNQDFFFQIPIIINPQNRNIISCSEEVKLQETCELRNGDYNLQTRQCDLVNSCMFQGTFSCPDTGACSSGSTNPFNNNQRNCPAGSAPQLTGCSVENNTCFRQFTCLACPAGVLGVPTFTNCNLICGPSGPNGETTTGGTTGATTSGTTSGTTTGGATVVATDPGADVPTTGTTTSGTTGGTASSGPSCIANGINCLPNNFPNNCNQCCVPPLATTTADCSHGGVCGQECRPNQ